jgi:hypothetical protein
VVYFLFVESVVCIIPLCRRVCRRRWLLCGPEDETDIRSITQVVLSTRLSPAWYRPNNQGAGGGGVEENMLLKQRHLSL